MTEENKDISKTSEKGQTDEVEITKDALVAIVVIKTRKDDGSYYLTAKEISASYYSSPFSSIDLKDIDEVISVIPALPESYRVEGYNGNTFELLGYEFKGAYHIEWKDELKRIKEAESRHQEHCRKTIPNWRG